MVPASSGVLDLLVELLPPERVAGLPEQALIYSKPLPAGHALLSRPRFEKYDGESVLALDPDLVVAQAWQSHETTARLREAGVNVQLLEAANDWATLRTRITQLGAWLHEPARAAELVARTDARVDALLALPASNLTALAYSNYGGHGRVAAAETTSHEILRFAGLRDLAAEAGLVDHPSFSFEQLLAADPDVLVVGRADSGAAGSTLETLHSDPRLAELRAVREGRVLALPSWLNTTTSHHMLSAAEELRAQLDALPR
ncbi:MAG: hypothetical protein DHS20C15_21690 [Planctomycetota bacterium]|nr:MAG: hypothetical protein DHS20C15_21690 [Planctomycetota bacterium]